MRTWRIELARNSDELQAKIKGLVETGFDILKVVTTEHGYALLVEPAAQRLTAAQQAAIEHCLTRGNPSRTVALVRDDSGKVIGANVYGA